ncbi:GT-D fold domain-containing glycosyltransferase [Klebsiella pneumoniae]
MLNKNTIYRKVRFPFKIIHALIKYPMANLKSKKYTVLTLEETMDLLLNNDNLSISRYGDGELGMTTFNNIGFQSFDENLSIRLKEIMQEGIKNKNCLICMPDAFRGTKNMRFGPSLFWFFHKAFRFKSYEYLLNDKYQYGNTSITRPYIDYKEKKQSKVIFEKFKQIFKDKKILIVEGAGTRLGRGNDLLANALEIKRITTINKNAFSLYTVLYRTVLDHAKDFDLVLISLGPTATVLSYDISKHGIRCIDTGHIDIEYEWMCSSAQNKVAVNRKNVNEAGVLLSDEDKETDDDYQRQVIMHIGIKNQPQKG